MFSRNRTGLLARITAAATFVYLVALLCPPLSAQTTLPYHGTANSGSTLWWITQTGSGGAGKFEISNSSSATRALSATTTGSGYAIYANSTGGYAGYFTTASGVYGLYEYGGCNGIYGESPNSNGNGVVGVANNGSLAYGVWGLSTNGFAGYFSGNATVTGTLYATVKNFKIDHPLDPANKYLVHSCVESAEMKNLYDGVVILDARGQAWVDLPDWFESLNGDFRYQLTCIGGFAPVYIAQEITGNRFQIAGGTPGMKVSWQVTGVRQDAYAKAHPMQVEQWKPDNERGTYLHPVEHGRPETMSVDYEKMRRLKQRPGSSFGK